MTVSLGGHVLVVTIGQRQALFDGALFDGAKGDKKQHTVTDFDANAYDLNLEVGEALSVTYTTPGIHRYWCVVHDQVDGSVTVAAPGP